MVCRQALNAAVDYGLLAVNPVLRAKSRRITETPIAPPSPSDATPPLKGLLVLLGVIRVSAGRGEALGLQWTDIDWEQKTATIRTIQVGKASQRRLHAPKTQSGRDPGLVGLSRSDFAEPPGPATHGMECGSCRRAPSTVGLYHPTRYLASSGRRTFKILLRRAGLPETTRIHDLCYPNLGRRTRQW